MTYLPWYFCIFWTFIALTYAQKQETYIQCSVEQVELTSEDIKDHEPYFRSSRYYSINSKSDYGRLEIMSITYSYLSGNYNALEQQTLKKLWAKIEKNFNLMNSDRITAITDEEIFHLIIQHKPSHWNQVQQPASEILYLYKLIKQQLAARKYPHRYFRYHLTCNDNTIHMMSILEQQNLQLTKNLKFFNNHEEEQLLQLKHQEETQGLMKLFK